MRWDGLRAGAGDDLPEGEPADGGRVDGRRARSEPAAPHPPLAVPLPLALPGAVTRTFDTPGFAGMTFYEVHAKSLLNRVPAASTVPFRWTINPYRGCGHACTYCFARNTHTYLDLDAGHDFDSKVIVKVNAGHLLRRELAADRWRGEPIAMGTNVDCYQRAEGRYRLMRQIIAALRDFANPFSILTKGTLILRDLDLLRDAASVTEVGLSMSVGFVDETLWRSVEPGAPSPRRRLDAVRRLTDAGLPVGVLIAPILPGITDDDESLEATVSAVARAGAIGATPLPLHLRPGAREWYLAWLRSAHPELVGRYRELFRGGSYSPHAYQRAVVDRVRAMAERHGIGLRDRAAARTSAAPPTDAVTPGDPRAPAHGSAPGRSARRSAAGSPASGVAAEPATQLTLL